MKDFIINHYIWFLIIALILIFALIGFLVDTTTPKKKKNKNIIKPIAQIEDEKTLHPSMEVYTNDDFDDPLIK